MKNQETTEIIHFIYQGIMANSIQQGLFLPSIKQKQQRANDFSHMNPLKNKL